MVGFACRQVAIVFVSLCFAVVAEDCIGDQCESTGETSLAQIKRHVHTGTQHAEKQTGPLDPSRLIGGTSGITTIQAETVSKMLDGYDVVHWDGDGVSMGSFTEALGIGIKPFVEKDMKDKYASGTCKEGRPAYAHYLPGTPDSWIAADRPKVMMGQAQIDEATKTMTEKMDGDAWLTTFDSLKKNAKYVQLAAADIAAAPPKKVFWLFDENRDAGTYDQWIGLAEWYAFCDEYEYVIVDSTGRIVTPEDGNLAFLVTAEGMKWGNKADIKCGR